MLLSNSSQCALNYAFVELRNPEHPQDIRLAFYLDDGTLEARLSCLVSSAEAVGTLKMLRRGETVNLAGRFTKRQLVNMSRYTSNVLTA